MISWTRLAPKVAMPVVAAVLAAGMVGCSFGGDDGAEKLADRLATALEEYDVKGIPFTDDGAAKMLGELLAPIEEFPSTIEVDGLEVEDGDRAGGTLRWRTEVGDAIWEHEGEVSLVKSGEEWNVVAGEALVEESLGGGDTLAVTTLKARRGRILGADRAVLVRPRPVLRIGLDKSQVPTGRNVRSAQELARALDIDVPGYVDLVRRSGPRQFVQALVMRRSDVTPEFGLRWEGIAGAVGLADQLPLAPTRAFARQVLGTVGPATAELIEKSEGRLAAGDDAGLSGLQLRYDEELGGTSGRKISAVPADPEEERRELFSAPAVDGADVRTTLDPALQQRADDLLAEAGSDAAIVALQPSTGAILAAASGPESNGYNTATFGQYAPGSTFKVVTALALLRAGLDPQSKVQCTSRISVNGKGFENYDDYPSDRLGAITLEQAVANSCNTGFISQRGKLASESLSQAAASLGLGVDHDLGFPAYFGQVPPPAGETEEAADMIGQGKVLASPMAMATVLGSVLAGRTVVPHLLTETAPQANPDPALTKAEAQALRQMLRAVVTEGSGAALAHLGDGVIAKTGTAEFGQEEPPQTHAWMVAGRGDLAVAVFVAVGESGSRTAGPILDAFLSSAF